MYIVSPPGILLYISNRDAVNTCQTHVFVVRYSLLISQRLARLQRVLDQPWVCARRQNDLNIMIALAPLAHAVHAGFWVASTLSPEAWGYRARPGPAPQED